MSHPEFGIVRMALLGAWVCGKVDSDENAFIDFVRNNTGCPPGLSDELIADRLYGGFHCGEEPDRRHAYFALGEYTYINENWPNEGRSESWAKLIDANPEWDGQGPFCSDAPAIESREGAPA